MTPTRAQVRAALEALMERYGFTQGALADDLGVSRQSVVKWLSGERQMPALTYEYLSLLMQSAAVRRARMAWRTSGDGNGKPRTYRTGQSREP